MTFYMNPIEAMKMNQSAIPIMGLAEDAVKMILNMTQETARLAGALDPIKNNPTPFFHYTGNFVPGVTQLRKFVDE